MVERTKAPGPTLDSDTNALADETTEQVTQAGGDALFLRIKNWFQASQTHSAPWRTEAEELHGMVAGDQWDEEDAEKLRKQQRPVITFNRMGPVIDSICGLEVNNRQEVQYLPRQQGTVRPNEIFTAAAKWARDECNAEDEESDAFRDSAISGMGWTETRVDYEVDPEGLMEVERVDGLEMFWDPSAKKRNLMDRRFHMRVRRMPLEDAEAMFPDFDAVDLDAKWAAIRDGNLTPHNATEAPFYKNDQSSRDGEGRDRALVTIVYCEWWVREPYIRVVHPGTNEKMEMSADEFARVDERAKMVGIHLQSAKLTRKRYMQAFVGNRILEEKPGRCKNGFSINCMTGKRDRNKNLWYGIARPMKDPQQWANKFFSQILYIINSNAKGGVIAEKDAVDNVRAFEEKWADPSGITWVRSGGIEKIQAKTAITFPTGLEKLMEFAISSIRDTTGVNLELIGLADRQQAGVLEAQRKQSGMTMLASLFDSLRLYRKEQGKVLLYMIQEYLSPGRLIRITGDAEDAKYMPLVKDPQTIEYDVVVDEAPSSPNQKEKVWLMLEQLAPMLVKLGVPPAVLLEFLTYSPLPNSLVQKIREAVMAPQQPNPMAHAEAELKAAQTENQRAQAVEHMAKAGVTQAGPQLQLAQLIADAMGQHADQQHVLQQQAMDQQHAAAGQGADHAQDMRSQVLGHVADLASQGAAQDHEQQLAQMQPQQAAEPSAAGFR